MAEYKRLTLRARDGSGMVDCDMCPLSGKCYVSADCTIVLEDRLAAYEDTGLSPEQVKEMADAQKWISVTDRMPEEEESYFARYYGTPKWDTAMFRKKSNDVLITIRDEDGDADVVLANTCDGDWNAGILQIKRKRYEVTHWMPCPEPAKETNND